MDPANFAVSRASREFAPPEVGNLRIVTPGVGAVADDIARSSEPAGARRDAL
jgi:orotidine-5'-phosphate decarboxylase